MERSLHRLPIPRPLVSISMPSSVTFVRAVNEALRRSLQDDDRVLVFGEDLGPSGGVFGVTKGLQAKFGEQRVFGTPISEAAILGAAIGAAQRGLRPVPEIMWSDFSLVAFDQIANQAANARYVSRGAITAPITIRTQQGATPGSCAQHSQNLEAFFVHVPGIRVCMPSNPQDAYDLLRAAIACDDPVVVIENRRLYPLKGEVDFERDVQPIGGAQVVRKGGDVTLLSWGRMVHEAESAARALAADGIDTEVLDLRWLNPLDLEAIVKSVRRTTRAVIVHEANITGGFGAEVAAQLSQICFDVLSAPVQRLGLSDLRVSAAPHLQDAVIPSSRDIVEAVSRLVAGVPA